MTICGCAGRLASAGWHSAFVPLAQVHHGFGQSEQRSHTRVPRTLFDIGASTRRYLDKHADPQVHTAIVERLVTRQRARLIGLMVEGRVEPRDISRLLGTLQSGLSKVPEFGSQAQRTGKNRAFTPLGHTAPNSFIGLAGSTFSREKIVKRAVFLAQSGCTSLVFVYSLTSLFHRRYFDPQGFWVQQGGLFGKSERRDPIMRMCSIRSRTLIEFERLKRLFPVSETQIVKMFRNFVSEKTKSEGTR